MADWSEPEFLTLLNPALSVVEVANLRQLDEIGGLQTVREAVHTCAASRAQQSGGAQMPGC